MVKQAVLGMVEQALAARAAATATPAADNGAALAGGSSPGHLNATPAGRGTGGDIFGQVSSPDAPMELSFALAGSPAAAEAVSPPGLQVR